MDILVVNPHLMEKANGGMASQQECQYQIDPRTDVQGPQGRDCANGVPEVKKNIRDAAAEKRPWDTA